MLLAVDIGNTKINLGIIDKVGRIKKRYNLPTRKKGLVSVLHRIKKTCYIDVIAIVSVVPWALLHVESAIKRYFPDIKVYVVGREIKVPIRSDYNKKQIGQDRLVTAFAAKRIYGTPLLIIDFGTAITFDFISEDGCYKGGLILSGIKMSLESLHAKTALLPKTFLKKTKTFIGKDTVSSIRNGLIYGYASLCDGLIKLFRKKISKSLKVVATGGDAMLIAQYSSSLKRIDTSLALKGIYLMLNYS